MPLVGFQEAMEQKVNAYHRKKSKLIERPDKFCLSDQRTLQAIKLANKGTLQVQQTTSTMQTITISFQYNLRTVYTAIVNLMEKLKPFSAVKRNDALYTIEARRGPWLSPFSECVKIKVTATSSTTTEMRIESSSRSVLNLFNFGVNKANVNNLKQYVCNEVHRLQTVVHSNADGITADHSTTRIAPSNIWTN